MLRICGRRIAGYVGAGALSFGYSSSACSANHAEEKNRSSVLATTQIASIGNITCLFRDLDEFENKLGQVMKGGAKSLAIVSDFDYTLTHFTQADGRSRASSCHKILEDCGLLPSEYHHAAQELQRVYYPLEIDPNLSWDERVKYMVEWVTKAHQLLLSSGLSIDKLKLAASQGSDAGRVRLRAGVSTLFDMAQVNQVPIVVFSAGIADVLETVIHHNFKTTKLPDNAFVISNRCIFDEKTGKLIGFHEPLLHVFNKEFGAHFSPDHPVYKRLQHRENLILIGDSLGDINMSVGLPHNPNTLIKIGFLNDRPERLPEYLKAFDVVILGDPSLEFINNLMLAICGNSNSNSNSNTGKSCKSCNSCNSGNSGNNNNNADAI